MNEHERAVWLSVARQLDPLMRLGRDALDTDAYLLLLDFGAHLFRAEAERLGHGAGAERVAALLDILAGARWCPVCGGTSWAEAYDEVGDGESVLVARCERCGWPPLHPTTLADYREQWEGDL